MAKHYPPPPTSPRPPGPSARAVRPRRPLAWAGLGDRCRTDPRARREAALGRGRAPVKDDPGGQEIFVLVIAALER
ncbi:hypothetical protein [Nonomuraea basaltis]|uniref:hypothetical protein n=1 Tax=Nonomuraea basaltis TaxID=2495887 RepID=UPI00110C53AD|nr:hypothetical protein [Nonomuraea basaltis]TMS00541.1 hypothetical protein EJK15_00900 [Nonomuraea basaltis]